MGRRDQILQNKLCYFLSWFFFFATIIEKYFSVGPLVPSKSLSFSIFKISPSTDRSWAIAIAESSAKPASESISITLSKYLPSLRKISVSQQFATFLILFRSYQA